MYEWLTQYPIAHRGYHDMNQTVWENTDVAFSRAMEAGFAIECDIRLSADGIVMVFHDDDLNRLCGRDVTIEALTAAELDKITIGTSASKIPRLSDLFDLCNGRVPLIVELKAGAEDDARFVPAVLAEISAYKGPLALMSFDSKLVQALQAAECPCPIGLTAEGREPDKLSAHRALMTSGLDFISYYYDHLPNAFISDARERGIPVITWTVRDERARDITNQYADQMTFEGFDPRQ